MSLYLCNFETCLFYRSKKSNFTVTLPDLPFAGLLISIWPITSSGNLFNNYLMLIYGLQIGFFNKK